MQVTGPSSYRGTGSGSGRGSSFGSSSDVAPLRMRAALATAAPGFDVRSLQGIRTPTRDRAAAFANALRAVTCVYYPPSSPTQARAAHGS